MVHRRLALAKLTLTGTRDALITLGNAIAWPKSRLESDHEGSLDVHKLTRNCVLPAQLYGCTKRGEHGSTDATVVFSHFAE